MNSKKIGIVLIILGILLAITIFYIRTGETNHINHLIEDEGTCYLDDGTCLHDRNTIPYALGWAISAALVLFGFYVFNDKSSDILQKQNAEVSKALEESKKDEHFNAFLQGFSEEEQKILKAVKEQDGIKQSTLRYRTDISKTQLSLILKKLEESKYIKRKDSGKTKEVYLVKKY